MSKYQIKTRVRVVNGSLKDHTGEIVYISDRSGACPIYTIKFDGISRAIDYAESDVEAENLMDEPMDREFMERSDVWDAFIPMDVDDEDEFFRELAEIYPKYNEDHNIKRNRFKVSVFEGNEGPVPHVHVYYEHKESKEDVAYICLGKAEYAPQHIKKTKVLNTHERKALQEFFSTEVPNSYGKDHNGNFYQKTCWQLCVEHWIDENSGSEKYFEIDKDTGLYIMPDYTKLGL